VTPVSTENEPSRRSKLPNTATLIALGVVVVLVSAIAVALFLTSRPSFFARYKALTRRYDTLQTSVHRDLACNDCHTDQGGPVVHEAGLVGDFYTSLFSKQREPVFTKIAKPTSEACLKCHKGNWSWNSERTSKVPHPAHLRVSTETRECVACHKWTAHEEAYMEKHKKMPFSGVCATYGCHAGWKSAEECSTCHHTLLDDKEAWKKAHPKAVQAIGPNACLETCHDADQCRLCHTTGQTPVFTGLAAQTGVKAIEQQHTKADWIEKHGTLALVDKSKCLVCHVSEGECDDCHALRPKFHGSTTTWIGAHKEPGKQKERCLACHKEAQCKACHDQFKEMR
jgi:trimethylamine-N-oxide reductase cytochrome c-type subunit TorC